MRREKISTVLTAIFSLLIFLLISEVQALRVYQQVCSSSCGDIQNISYPFRLKGDPVGCGDPYYELSCENNKTILEFHSGKYYVKHISYKKHRIHVVDINLANGSCNLPYHSQLVDVKDDVVYKGLASQTYTSFMNCSRIISDPAYKRITCLSGNTSHVYVMYDRYTISDLHESCIYISMVPAPSVDVNYPSYGAILKLLESGFDLEWSVECRGCLLYGRSCTLSPYDSQNITDCYLPDSFVSTIISLLFSTLGSFLLVLFLMARFIFAPLVILVFLIHKFLTTRKPGRYHGELSTQSVVLDAQKVLLH